MFEKASRTKLRWNSSKGVLTVEHLWDLPLSQLDTIAKVTNKRIKEADEESFIAPKSAANAEDVLRLDIIKHIIAVRQAEQASILERKEKNNKRAILQEVLERKKSEALQNLSVEELQNQLNAL